MRKEEKLRMCSNWKVSKWGSFLMALRARGARLGFPLLLLFALVLGTAYSAQGGGSYIRLKFIILKCDLSHRYIY